MIDDRCLSKPFVEYIDGVRIYLEGESNGDLPILQDIRLHFSKFVRHLICNTPGKSLLAKDVIVWAHHLEAWGPSLALIV